MALFGGYTAHLCRAGTYEHRNYNVESSTGFARPPPYSAVDGKTALFSSCTDLVIRLAHVPPSTVLPHPTLLLGRMLPVFCFVQLTARPSTLLPPLHCCWGRSCLFVYGWPRDPLITYTTLGQMLLVFVYTVGCGILYYATPPTLVLGDPLLCYPPTLHVG